MSHSQDFGLESGDEETARQLAADYRQTELNAEDRALCDYAIKLTLAPGEMTRDDVQTLRDCGFSDEQITVATQVIGYFNYITRVAQALGADPEPWMQITREQWLATKGRDYLSK